MNKLISVLLLLVTAQYICAQEDWATIAKEKSKIEVQKSKELLTSVAYTDLIMKQLWLTQSIDVDKTVAAEYIKMSISPNTKLFKDGSFMDVVKAQVNQSFKPDSKIGKEALAAGLDNATNSNGLLTSVLSINPVGAAVSSIFSVVNGFLEKKGVFLFFSKLFAPNFEEQIRSFESSMAPYISFYQSLDNEISNSILAYSNYSTIISNDLTELDELFNQYKQYRNLLTGKEEASQTQFLAYIQTIEATNVTVESYLGFIRNKHLQDLVSVCEKMKRKDIEMAFHSLAFNMEVQKNLTNWVNLLKTNDLTKDRISEKPLSDIVSSIDSENASIAQNINKLKEIIKQRESNNALESTGENLLKIQLNDSFFRPSEKFINIPSNKQLLFPLIN